LEEAMKLKGEEVLTIQPWLSPTIGKSCVMTFIISKRLTSMDAPDLEEVSSRGQEGSR